MADNDIKDTEKSEPQKSGGGKMMMLILAAIVLVGGAVGATLMMTGGKKSEDAMVVVDERAPQVSRVPIYYAIDPAFVVNFTDDDHIRYLQVNIEVMSYSQDAITAIENHKPLIRNNMIILLSNLTFEDISTAEGKEKIRLDTLKEVQSILRQKTGSDGVEDLFFTNFVMQ